MNIKFYLWVIGIGLSACSADVPATSGKAPLRLDGVSMAAMQAGETRGMAVEGAIGVFRKNREANVKYSNGSGQWTTWQCFDGNTLPGIWLSEAEETFAVYYPYAAGQTTTKVTLTSRIYADEADLCAATFKTTALNPSPSVTLEHCYVLIRLRIVRSADYADLPVVNRLTLGGVVASATYDLFTRELIMGGATHQLVWDTTPLKPMDAVEGSYPFSSIARFLVVPFTPGSDMWLTLETSSGSFSTVIPKAQSTEGRYRAGNCYTWDVVMGATGLKVTPTSNMLEQEWTEGATASGGLVL